MLCDKKVSLKLKGKFYNIAVMPILYNSERWMPATRDGFTPGAVGVLAPSVVFNVYNVSVF